MNIEINDRNRFFSVFGFEVDEVIALGFISWYKITKRAKMINPKIHLDFVFSLNEKYQ